MPGHEAAILALLLGGYVFVAWHVGTQIGPFRGDPDYSYLLSGLALMQGRTPGFVDHPGTPLELFAGLTAFARWLVTPHQGMSFTDHVLTHAEAYLAFIALLLTGLSAAAMAYFVVSLRAATRTLSTALLALLMVLGSDVMFSTFHRVYAEPVLLAAGLVLAGLLAPFAFGAEPSRRQAIATGVLIALCIATKITAAPVVLAVFMLPARRSHALGAAALALALFLAPIWQRWPHLIVTNLHILSHQGDYGTGGAGLPSLAALKSNLILDLHYAPEVFFALELTAVLLIGVRLARYRLADARLRALSVCAAILAAAIVLYAKQPREAYFVPALPFAGLAIALVVDLVLKVTKLAARWRVAAVLLLALEAAYAQELHASHIGDDWRAQAGLLARAARTPCLVAPYYFVDQPQWDLYFADSDFAFAADLKRLYPRFVAYDVGLKRFASFAGPMTPAEAAARFASEKCVMLLGLTWRPEYGLAPSQLQRVDGTTYHALYRYHPDPPAR